MLALLAATVCGVWSLSSGGCSADIAELDGCVDVAKAYCHHLKKCGLASDEDRCSKDLAKQCTRVDQFGFSASDGNDCARDLENADFCDTVPTTCPDLGSRLGCNSCATVGDGALQQACCSIDPFSPVCGGC
jgi:hypothetical protein